MRKHLKDLKSWPCGNLGKMFQGGEQPVQRPRGGNSSKANTACVGCMLLTRPLEALDFTKSPLVAGKMNKKPILDHYLQNILG